MIKIQCPYCGYNNEHNFEQSEDGCAHETQCESCEKNFIFFVEWLPCFSTRKADCLNGGEHDWRNLLDEHSSRYYLFRRGCRQCEQLEYELRRDTEAPEVKGDE